MYQVKYCAVRPWMPVFLVLANIFERRDCLPQFLLKLIRYGIVGL
jgi:hypothetical protein